MKKKKKNTKLFIGIFAVIIAMTIVSNLVRKDMTLLAVPNNPGVSGLETVDDMLVCTFADGRVVSWNWDGYQQTGDFKAASDRAVVLDPQHLAAVNTEGKKWLTVYSLSDSQKQKDISVGWDDQDVWLRISPDKQTVALIRRNSPDSKGSVLFEFLSTNIQDEVLSYPISVSVQEKSDNFVDYAVNNNGILYAVGSKNDAGCIVAVDLEKGVILWDTVFENAKEFCSCTASPDGSSLYAGNRDGLLYKIDSFTGQIAQKIQLLEEGETRPITNDYSVLNLAFSPDGHYYVATINPKAYILKADSDGIVYSFSPADRLVSKIAFSPDSKFVATSDVRAGYPVKIWPLPVAE